MTPNDPTDCLVPRRPHRYAIGTLDASGPAIASLPAPTDTRIRHARFCRRSSRTTSPAATTRPAVAVSRPACTSPGGVPTRWTLAANDLGDDLPAVCQPWLVSRIVAAAHGARHLGIVLSGQYALVAEPAGR